MCSCVLERRRKKPQESCARQLEVEEEAALREEAAPTCGRPADHLTSNVMLPLQPPKQSTAECPRGRRRVHQPPDRGEAARNSCLTRTHKPSATHHRRARAPNRASLAATQAAVNSSRGAPAGPAQGRRHVPAPFVATRPPCPSNATILLPSTVRSRPASKLRSGATIAQIPNHARSLRRREARRRRSPPSPGPFRLPEGSSWSGGSFPTLGWLLGAVIRRCRSPEPPPRLGQRRKKAGD